ncbi:MAG: LPS export ABC transporter periplasmic protein LptC [Xanthomonadales bacterium]|nr:LPS export ABC transporter periplasmic protein LptC [Xanthomonadales bacterium]
MRKRTLFAILLFAGFALFSRWLVNQQSDQTEATTSSQRSSIDYELENFVARSFDEKGFLVFQMNAPRMSKDTTSGVTRVSHPRILWPQRKTNKKTTLLADSGLISDDQNEIHLSGNVVVKSRSAVEGNDSQPITLRTEELSFNQTDRLLTSNVLISITAPGLQISGIGMNANLDTEQINLQQQVKGQYETQ